MSTLQVFLFGDIRVVHDGRPFKVRLTRTLQVLLAYLLLQRHRNHPREVLAGIFWGDYTEERARNCLSTALWRLRLMLEPENIPRGTYLMSAQTGEVGFNCESDHWLDVAIFEAHADRILARPIHAIGAADALALENALQLYTCELLEGFYDDWALRERERLRCVYLSSLVHLMHYYKRHAAYEKSLACGQQILHHDPLREEIHPEVMLLHLENGQRAMALRQYETCRRTLAEELNIPPMEETQALYAQIMAAGSHRRMQSTLVGKPTRLQHALQQLRRARQGFDEAQEQLQRAIQLVERFGKCQDP